MSAAGEAVRSEEGFVFVTGATSNTGARVVARLLGEGREVKALTRDEARAGRLPRSERLEIVVGDLDRHEEWIERVRGAAAVVHLAHIGFGERIVTLCEAAGARRLVALSSARRFTRFADASARRVIAGEERIERSGLDYTILRSTMIYGGGRDNNVERVRRWLKRRRWMPLVGGGASLVQPIYSSDLADAIVRALANPKSTARRSLTVAGPRAITWKEMIETIAAGSDRPVSWLPVPYPLALAGAAILGFLPGRAPVTRDQVRRLLEDKAFDISEASEALGGWQPCPFMEGLAADRTQK